LWVKLFSTQGREERERALIDRFQLSEAKLRREAKALGKDFSLSLHIKTFDSYLQMEKHYIDSRRPRMCIAEREETHRRGKMSGKIYVSEVNIDKRGKKSFSLSLGVYGM
jgi:hypothetical protein